MNGMIPLERFDKAIDAQMAMSTLKNADIVYFFKINCNRLSLNNSGGILKVYEKDAETAFHLLHPDEPLFPRVLPYYQSTTTDIQITNKQWRDVLWVAALIILLILFFKYFTL